jgi:hypothetical protein
MVVGSVATGAVADLPAVEPQTWGVTGGESQPSGNPIFRVKSRAWAIRHHARFVVCRGQQEETQTIEKRLLPMFGGTESNHGLV